MGIKSIVKRNKLLYTPLHTANVLRIEITNFIKYIKADRIKLIVNNKNDKNKYLIFQYKGTQGLMAQMESVLAWVKYAVDKRYTLIVDMTDKNNIYKIGDENAWENYYQQPMLSGSASESFIKEIMRDKNYALCPPVDRAALIWIRDFTKYKNMLKPSIIHPSTRDYKNNVIIQKEFEGLFKKYIRCTPEVARYLQDEYEKVLKNKSGKVVGVIVRGTDYTAQRPYMHPIQPELSDVLAKVREYLDSGAYKYIYLATDEKKVQDEFEKCFPGKLIINKREYYESDNYDDKPVREIHLDRENDTYLRGLEYLSSMNLLANCDVLVGGLCGGSQAAILMNGGKYKDIHLFDLGDYGMQQ